MAVYACIGCDLDYCATCDGGEDACAACGTGPRCPDCAADHKRDEHGPCTECEGKGWGVFDADDERGLHVERCDSCGLFADDIEAEARVQLLARNGDPEALETLAAVWLEA